MNIQWENNNIINYFFINNKFFNSTAFILKSKYSKKCLSLSNRKHITLQISIPIRIQNNIRHIFWILSYDDCII